MKVENNIGWCDATTNAVTGCDKISPGCKNCYAEAGTRARVLRAQGKETWGAKGERVPVNFEPVFRRLNKLMICDDCREAYNFTISDKRPACPKCETFLRRIRLFADSNSDWLDPKWPVETLAKFLDAIRLAPNVDVLLLTKRIELWELRITAVLKTIESSPEWEANVIPTPMVDLRNWLADWLVLKRAPSNIWIGVSAEDQKRADERIPELLNTPAAVRFLSVEPLLERTSLFEYFHEGNEMSNGGRIDWVIVGGESGRHRRDCGATAIELVVAQSVNAGVPVYCKQDSAMMSGERGNLSDEAWSRKEFPR